MSPSRQHEEGPRGHSVWRSASQMILGLVGGPHGGADTRDELRELGGVEMRPLTLTFDSAEIEADYRAARIPKALPLARFALMAGIVLYAVFGVLDPVLFSPAERDAIWGVRFAVVCPVLAVLLLATWVERVQPYLSALLVFALSVSGLGIIAMTVIALPPNGDLYYAGLLLVLFFGYILLPLRFVHATAVGWAMVLAYQVAALWLRPVSLDQLLNNDFFFVSANFVGMVGAYIIEAHRRRDHLALRVIDRERKALAAANRRLTELAIRDPLTGLMNRRTLMERVHEAIALSRRYGVVSTVLLLDLDHFKRVNDTLGHVAGDELLRAVANVIRNDVRAPDQAFRYGGDEFVVLLPNTPPELAVHLANRLLDSVRYRCGHTLPAELGVGCSIGVAAVRAGTDSAEDVLAEVDEALYRAKDLGKGQVHVWMVPKEDPQSIAL